MAVLAKGMFKTRNGEMTKWRNGEMIYIKFKSFLFGKLK